MRSFLFRLAPAVILTAGSGIAAHAQGSCDPALAASNGGQCPPSSQVLRLAGAAPYVHPDFDSNCGTPRDLRTDGPRPPLARVPIRDQDGMGICYATAAANLVDAWRFSAGGETNYGHITSAVAAAASSGAREWFRHNPNSLNGGAVCTVAENIRARGSCDERAAVSGFARGRTYSDAIALVRGYYDRYQAWLESRSTLDRLAEFDSGSRAAAERLTRRRRAAEAAEACLADLGVRVAIRPSVAVLERLMDDDNPLSYLEGVFAAGCAGSHQYVPWGLPSCEDEYQPSGVDAFRAIQARLNRSNPQPVAISFCAKVLTHGRGVAAVTGRHWAPRYRSLASDCGYHSALVAGQRRDPVTGKCQFLIRNSWGTSCDYYSTDWECNNGDLWVDAEHLAKNVDRIQYLE